MTFLFSNLNKRNPLVRQIACQKKTTGRNNNEEAWNRKIKRMRRPIKTRYFAFILTNGRFWCKFELDLTRKKNVEIILINKTSE